MTGQAGTPFAPILSSDSIKMIRIILPLIDQ